MRPSLDENVFMGERAERPQQKEMNMSTNVKPVSVATPSKTEREPAANAACCTPKEEESCCDASAKAACCGTPSAGRQAPSSCGCR